MFYIYIYIIFIFGKYHFYFASTHLQLPLISGRHQTYNLESVSTVFISSPFLHPD